MTQDKLIAFDEIQDSWLGLGNTRFIYPEYNPLVIRDNLFNDYPGLLEIDILRRPEYLGYAVWLLMGVRLLPFQMAIMYNLWTHAFPMLLMTRGGGKCVAGDTLIFTSQGIKKIEDIAGNVQDHVKKYTPGLKIYGKGGWRDCEYVWSNGSGATIKITTNRERILNATPNHPIRVMKNGLPVWVNMEDLNIGDKIIIENEYQWFEDHNDLTTEDAYELGLNTTDEVPPIVFGASRDSMKAFLSGYFEQLVVFNSNNNTFKINCKNKTVKYTIQFFLKLFDINTIASIFYPKGFLLTTTSFIKFNTKIGFINKTKLNEFEEYLRFTNQYSEDDEYIKKIEPSFAKTYDVYIPDDHSFVSNGFISHNSYLLAIYSLLRCLFYPEHKVVIAGASFRQSKLVFEYAENIWRTSPVLRSVCDDYSGPAHDIDRWNLRINDSLIMAIPIGPTGDKIRGLRANTIVCDEFAALNVDVYETVISGFASVSASPDEAVMKNARKKLLKDKGLKYDPGDEIEDVKNQSIISGTADYYFNHFYEYYKRYKSIIESRGDEQRLEEILGGPVSDEFNWRDYCIIRVPYTQLPRGFMDEKVITRAKATMNSAIFKKEYDAVFIEDSDGFYRRSLIESCVASEKNINKEGWAPWCPCPFEPMVRGHSDRKYVFGVDPASEQDNFAIIILEVYKDHSRIVYSWTTNRKDFQERQKVGFTKTDDYYGYCARKIRDLMKVFPCHRIALDIQGGGVAISEALHDRDKMEDGEEQIWDVVDYDNKKDSDNYKGEHIIESIQFAQPKWVSEANHGMRKDFEDKRLLFPQFDPLTIELSIAEDQARVAQFARENKGKQILLYDSLEDCVLEIESLKDELASIIMGRTSSGVHSRERWTVPEVMIEGNKKIKGRKDRYSALLMANMVARSMKVEEIHKKAVVYAGGLVTDKFSGGDLYSGPDWFVNGMKGL